jgi:hypothetical protein
MLLRKATSILLGVINEESLVINYYSFIITKSPYIIGDIYEMK